VLSANLHFKDAEEIRIQAEPPRWLEGPDQQLEDNTDTTESIMKCGCAVLLEIKRKGWAGRGSRNSGWKWWVRASPLSMRCV
jgi:hypothetical protein